VELIDSIARDDAAVIEGIIPRPGIRTADVIAALGA